MATRRPRPIRVGTLAPARHSEDGSRWECFRCDRSTVFRVTRMPIRGNRLAQVECCVCGSGQGGLGLPWIERAPTRRDLDGALRRNRQAQARLRAMASRLLTEREKGGR